MTNKTTDKLKVFDKNLLYLYIENKGELKELP